ncbi:hypothetical protein VTN49DRAFT_7449 [Thermomyces lanuginosus]|uniref:uncharacterized protein n=1 Tax=Thermomyces lanuginosus TaxID=5541 RepID=UPI003743FDD5
MPHTAKCIEEEHSNQIRARTEECKTKASVISATRNKQQPPCSSSFLSLDNSAREADSKRTQTETVALIVLKKKQI